MSAIWQQFSALPRFAQWLVYLLVFLVVFFVAIKPAMSYSQRYEDKAARIEKAIADRKDFAQADGGNGGVITSLQAVYGSPRLPNASSGVKPEAFTRVVDGILENHQISDRTVTERRVRMSGLSPDTASALNVTELDRLILEVTFEAHAEDVFAILADLEQAPEVAAVSRVKIDRTISRATEDEHLVRATLTPEAWIPTGASSSSEVGQ